NGSKAADSSWQASFAYEETRDSRAVFVNGIFQPGLSSLTALPEGVVAMEIAQALMSDEHGQAVREQLENGYHADENGFTTLNTALFSSGLLLRVSAGLQVEQPIHFQFIGQGGSNGAAPAAFPRVLILADAGSSATVIETYASPDEGVYLTNAIVDVALGTGARLEHYRVQRE